MSQEVKKPFISGLVEGSIDVKVYQDILQTHAKECITLLDFANVAITNVDQRTISRAEFTECEISPFHHHEYDCDVQQDPLFLRKPSTPRFSIQKADFSAIQTMLVNSFSPAHDERRPYPSAGGLYPVEPLVFLFQERLESRQEIISGAYHFRPVSKALQLIKKIPTTYFFDKLLHGLIAPDSYPCFAILYVAHLGKAIFKYRYRGYRQAVMEAGSMYQQAMFTSQQMGFRSTVWSTFGEHEVLYALDLDYGTYMPLTMQLFGYGELE